MPAFVQICGGDAVIVIGRRGGENFEQAQFDGEWLTPRDSRRQGGYHDGRLFWIPGPWRNHYSAAWEFDGHLVRPVNVFRHALAIRRADT